MKKKQLLLLAALVSGQYSVAKAVMDSDAMSADKDQVVQTLRSHVKQARDEKKEWHALKKDMHQEKQALKKKQMEKKVQWINDLIGKHTAQDLKKSLRDFDELHKENRAAWKQLMEKYLGKAKDLAQRQDAAEAAQK